MQINNLSMKIVFFLYSFNDKAMIKILLHMKVIILQEIVRLH